MKLVTNWYIKEQDVYIRLTPQIWIMNPRGLNVSSFVEILIMQVSTLRGPQIVEVSPLVSSLVGRLIVEVSTLV